MKILVLCHGNKYRSPTCEVVLKKLGMEVESAGFAYPKQRAAKSIRDTLRPFGYDLEEHRSRVVTKEMVDTADLILYMDGGNLKRLAAQFPYALNKARCLASYINKKRIPDPAFAPNPLEFSKIVDMIIAASISAHKKITIKGVSRYGKKQTI